MSSGSTLRIDPQRVEDSVVSDNMLLEDVEREHIKQVLRSTGWRVSGKNGAAIILGLKDSTLRSRMIKLSISRPLPGLKGD